MAQKGLWNLAKEKIMKEEENCQRKKETLWRYKFRVEASRCFRQAAAILDWAEDRYYQLISESDI